MTHRYFLCVVMIVLIVSAALFSFSFLKTDAATTTQELPVATRQLLDKSVFGENEQTLEMIHPRFTDGSTNIIFLLITRLNISLNLLRIMAIFFPITLTHRLALVNISSWNTPMMAATLAARGFLQTIVLLTRILSANLVLRLPLIRRPYLSRLPQRQLWQRPRPQQRPPQTKQQYSLLF